VDAASSRQWRVGALSRQDVIEHAAGTAELPRDLGLGAPGLDPAPGVGDLFRGELAGPAAVHTLGFGDLDALALALPDQGTFQLGDGTEQVPLERGEGVVGAGIETEALGDELDSDPAAGDLLDELGPETGNLTRSL